MFGLLVFATVTLGACRGLVLLRHPFGTIRTWEEPFGFQRRAECEADGLALTVTSEVITITGSGTVGHSILAKG